MKIHILSIENEGIRGIITSVILNYIEEELQKKLSIFMPGGEKRSFKKNQPLRYRFRIILCHRAGKTLKEKSVPFKVIFTKTGHRSCESFLALLM